MAKGFFITGTDTDAGKTWATLALIRCFQKHGQSVVGMKPVASGCRLDNGQWVNEDALLLQAQASVQVPYDWVNPYGYELPISPHLAGRDHPAELSRIKSRFQQLGQMADMVVVEGAGGWYAPINDEQFISDLALELALPVILVVAIRLGCINQAILSYRAIEQSGLNCSGWIAVCLDPDMQTVTDNIDTIEKHLAAPLLGVLPYIEKADFEVLSNHLHKAGKLLL